MSKITKVKMEGKGHVNVIATFDDGNTDTIFSYYDDELLFTENELLGLTEQQAGDLFTKKDIAYLRS